MYGYRVRSALALLIAAAAFLHASGAPGPYETVPGYDHVPHTLSATLVGGEAVLVQYGLEHIVLDLPFDSIAP